MPLDSRDKRASAMNPAMPWRGLWPLPDGTVGTGDRAMADFMYFTAGGGGTPPVSGASDYIPTWRPRRR